MEKKQIPNGYTQNDVNKIKEAERVVRKGAKVVPALIGADLIAWIACVGFKIADMKDAASFAASVGFLIPTAAVVGLLVFMNDMKKKEVLELSEDAELFNYAMNEANEDEKQKRKQKERDNYYRRF